MVAFDPMTLGVTAAALIAKKALEKAGEHAGESGWALLESVAERVRGWFSRRDDSKAEGALELVEQAPDSQSAIDKLAAAIAAAAQQDPDEAAQLAGLVEKTQAQAGPQVNTFVNQVRDNASVERIIQAGVYHER